MARRKYSRKVKANETKATVIILVAVLVVLGLASVPQEFIFQMIVVAASVAILVAVTYYYLTYRRQLAYQEGLRQLQIDDIDSMSGIAFEKYIADIFRRQGYMFETTAASGDMGVDLIIAKDGIRTAVQTKRYSKPVNQSAVREAVAGMKQYKCTKSMVVTNNRFTKLAIQLARTNECELIDRDELIKLLD